MCGSVYWYHAFRWSPLDLKALLFLFLFYVFYLELIWFVSNNDKGPPFGKYGTEWPSTLPMLMLLSYKAQERKFFWKPSKICHVATHWIALTKYSPMSNHMPGFQWFLRIFAAFCIGQFSTSSIRVTPLFILSTWPDPFYAEATFLQSTKTQIFLKTLKTMSCWYSLDSIHWVLSDEYPLARVSVIFQGFCIILHWPNQPPAA